jgi:hypothetical protein
VRKHSCPLKRDLSQKIEDVLPLTQTPPLGYDSYLR